MSGQRARSPVAADHRSAHPNIAGIPWWGAVLTAVIASLVGFAFDAGSGGQQLTAVFSGLYVIGCLVAVLAVQQSGLFTAVIQPPLVLFITVPTAYFLMRSGEIQGIKDILINCGYPLIERFPLMFFTSAAVLLIGLARWYFGKSVRAAAPEAADEPAPAKRAGGVSAKLSSFLGGAPAATETADEQPRERRASDRRRTGAAKPASGRTARSARTDKRATPRSRHSRPSETEIVEPVAERPRRRRPRPGDEPSDSSAEPRRRPRPSSRERDARDGVSPRERRQFDRDARYERQRPQQSERSQRRSRFDEYESPDPYGSNGTSTHHPISRVRYRGGDDNDDRPESGPRRRPPRDADRWEYDI